MSTIEEHVAELEARLTRVEAIVGEVAPETDAGKYLAVIDKLVAEKGWTPEEAATNFNNLLLSDEVQAQIKATEKP